MSTRKATAVWRGSLREGKGTMSVGSGAIKELPFTFDTRFGEAGGTNPEELIAAAHSGCFSMALSAELAKANLTPESIETSAALTLDRTDKGPTVTKIHLTTVARIPGASAEAFSAAAQTAKAHCVISRLLNTEITLDAKLA